MIQAKCITKRNPLFSYTFKLRPFSFDRLSSLRLVQSHERAGRYSTGGSHKVNGESEFYTFNATNRRSVQMGGAPPWTFGRKRADDDYQANYDSSISTTYTFRELLNLLEVDR
jgi:hypothetical protein